MSHRAGTKMRTRFGESLTAYRRTHHITRMRLAARMEISRFTLNEYEYYGMMPRWDSLYRYAHLLEVPPCYFFGKGC